MKMLYQISTTLIGFLAHPYQTMQKVVDKDVPFLFIFFPLGLCVLVWFLARTSAPFFLGIVPYIGFWWFVEVWWLLFWGMWQLTLLYLYLRFSSVHPVSE